MQLGTGPTSCMALLRKGPQPEGAQAGISCLSQQGGGFRRLGKAQVALENRQELPAHIQNVNPLGTGGFSPLRELYRK